MGLAPPLTITLKGFFTSQKWLRARSLPELERLLGYRAGRLSSQGALVYAFRRVPEPWEFEVRGYTNVSGGLDLSPGWKAAESAAAAYHKRYAIPDAVTRMKNNARATMTATGPDRLVKVKPVLWDPDDSYPPGSGIVQWRVSELAGERGVLLGDLLTTLKPGDLYPLAAR